MFTLLCYLNYAIIYIFFLMKSEDAFETPCTDTIIIIIIIIIIFLSLYVSVCVCMCVYVCVCVCVCKKLKTASVPALYHPSHPLT